MGIIHIRPVAADIFTVDLEIRFEMMLCNKIYCIMMAVKGNIRTGTDLLDELLFYFKTGYVLVM